MSVKYPNYVNLTSLSEEQQNKRTPSPPPRKKSLSPPQAPSKSISSKSTHYTSSSSPSESPTPTHVAPPPKLRFVISIKLEPQELPPLQVLPNDPYVQTMDNWPLGPSNPSSPPRVTRPPPGFPNPPPRFEPFPSTQPLFFNINNNTPLLNNNAHLLENIHHPPTNLGNQDFPNPPNILDCVNLNDMPHLHNMFDIQCIGSDTRPPMLDKTDFALWQQRIQLYCRGKENGVNILKSIDEGTFQMGTFQETLAEGTEGGPHLGLPKDIYSLINHYTDAKDIWDNEKMLLEGSELTKEDRESQLPHRKELHSTQASTELQILQRQDVADDLALNVDNVFQADYYDAFNFDVDEAPTTQTMFMANLSSADPVYDKAGPSYDSDILSEVHDHDYYQDVVCEHHEEHEMHDDVQPTYVVDSHVDYTSDSNMIPYDQYVKDNAVPVIQSNVSFVPNDAYMMIFNDMHESHAQSVSDTTRNTVVDNSLTIELATYKEQVELYERQARFELTEREQKIDEQLRIVIIDRNIKEENLKKELHSVKMQLASTINHNKSMPALYNGYEIIKNNHVPALVHNTEDTLEIAKITRRKMNDKMKDPECVTHKVKIAPPDYSKENYLATVTPQKQLTPEQIFWSQDLIKMKEEALKKQTTALRPIKALMVYPPNTPATLVPRVLLTKIQVKIHIFSLIQLFSEFEKTCKKRITPTWLTEGERGFE
ncbi:hypothetical protein Tco_0705606 [Tanacetum coccineum]|uniref:Integrase, catalytic region, zinc finger, CCHC-type, peptidase aspartic, catalytic n=1 Tax=Tanacetum coccineum TaxID=301880 RepID=A0ABQ4Y538_9ASTR